MLFIDLLKRKWYCLLQKKGLLFPTEAATLCARCLFPCLDRNRAKRQVREAWRLNKDILICAAEGPKPVARTLHIAFLWLADELQESELIQRKMRNLLHRIAEEINAGDLNNRS